jgi:hypothetical protein
MPPGEAAVADVERLAAEKLGVEPGMEPGERRAALLRRLHDEDYLPDPALHEAIRLLAGRPVRQGSESPLQEEAAGAEEERLRGAVEEFAAAFFTVPIAERRERWHSLFRDCTAHERLRDRLLGLKPGLGVDRDTIPIRPPGVRRLAEIILALFVLRPGPRATRRRELLGELLGDPSLRRSDLARARKRLMRRHPDVAALSDGVLLQLARPGRPLSAVRRRSQIASVLHRKASDPPVAERSNRFPSWLLMFLLWVGPGLFGLLSSTGFRAKDRPAGIGSPPPAPTPKLSRDQTIEVLFPRVSSGRAPSAKAVRAFHDEFKAPIRRELAKFGATLREDQLQRVVDAMPSDVGSRQPGGLAASILFGLWTETERDRYAECLKQALVAEGVALDDEKLDAAALGSLPTPVDRPSRGAGRPPGRAQASAKPSNRPERP